MAGNPDSACKQKSSYLKLKDFWGHEFGGRVQKISLHAGFTCPNRDGSLGIGGCLYCSNEAFTPHYCHEGASIEEQIDAGISFQKRRYPRAVGFLGYLQAYTNTYGPMEQLVDSYECVLKDDRLLGMVIGTRPDCLPASLVDWLQQASRQKPIYLELGIESFSDEILASMNRGHTFPAAVAAVERLADSGLPVGGHFLVGFPGEPWNRFFEQADRLNALPLHSVKVHQLHVFRDTPLERIYRQNPGMFEFPSKQAYMDAAAGWLERLRPDLYIDRIFGDAPMKFIVNPSWGIRMDRIVAEFEALLEQRDIRQGSKFPGPADGVSTGLLRNPTL